MNNLISFEVCPRDTLRPPVEYDGPPPPVDLDDNDEGGGRPRCAQCTWMNSTTELRLRVESVEKSGLDPNDANPALNPQQRGALYVDRRMGVRNPAVGEAVEAARDTPCDGPVAEKRFRFLGRKFGRVVVRCSNPAIPWGRLPGSTYPGRRNLFGEVGEE